VILRDAFVRMHSEDITSRLAAEFTARYADNMYRANVHASTEVGKRISKWRIANKLAKTSATQGVTQKHGMASFDEVALEAQRQDLLKSEDPELRAKGEAMVTPTSIWLETKDPKTLASFRLSLLGETGPETKTKKTPSKFDEIVENSKALEEAVMNSEDPDSVTPKPKTDSPPKRASKYLSEVSTVQVWLPLSFPPVPKKGDWDVARLRESKYFFS
jgi:DNA-directed RNA polymerase, mitochondrial